MKKLLAFILLFVYFSAKSNDFNLPYYGETLIQYSKPYIYIIERTQYRTIKIPEMTVSAPVRFVFSDSSFAKKFTPTNYLLSKVSQKLYLTDNLGGAVLEIQENKITRIDQSFEHKMQINGQTFTHDHRIFKFGGYGFWSARNFFTYFDLNSKEWEAYSPVQGDELPPGLFDVNQFINGDDITYFNGITINPHDNLKFEKTQDVWHFNLRSKTWESKGKTSLFFGNNPQNFQYQNYYVAFNEERRIIRVNFNDNSYEIFSNEAISTKISEKFKPFVENGRMYFFSNNHSNFGIELASIPIADFLGKPLEKNKFLEQNFWKEYSPYAFAILGLITLLSAAYFALKYRRSQSTYIQDKNGILFVGNASIQLEENELKVLKYLLKYNDVPNSQLLELVEQKGVHFSHNIRMKNDVLNQLNLKLKAVLQVDTNFIVFKKSDTDSRLKVYRLNKQYFRVSEEFLKE